MSFSTLAAVVSRQLIYFYHNPLTCLRDCKQGPEICQVLSQGMGRLHGIDSSPAMIKAAQKAHEEAGIKCATFEGKFKPDHKP